MRILPLLALTILIGCKPQVVYVPVPCPEPPVIQRPALPIETLKPSDSAQRERTLWVASVEALDYYSRQLEKILDGYRKPGSAK